MPGKIFAGSQEIYCYAAAVVDDYGRNHLHVDAHGNENDDGENTSVSENEKPNGNESESGSVNECENVNVSESESENPNEWRNVNESATSWNSIENVYLPEAKPLYSDYVSFDLKDICYHAHHLMFS